MSDHKQFLAEIAQHPADMFPRGVYADWLEERGDVRSEYIRLAIELAGQTECGWCGWSLKEKREDGCVLGDCSMRPIHRDLHNQKQAEMIHRCAALLAEHRREWTMAGIDGWFCLMDGPTPHDERPPEEWNMTGFSMNYPCDQNEIIRADFARGFPEVLTLRFEEWQRHYQTLIDAMPVREVKITRGPTHLDCLRITVTHNILIPPLEEDDRDVSNEWMLQCLAAAFPGHDPARPIRYTLPEPQSNQIDLTWTIDGMNWVAASNDSELTPNTTYHYRVRAINLTSPPTQPDPATQDACTPPP